MGRVIEALKSEAQAKVVSIETRKQNAKEMRHRYVQCEKELKEAREEQKVEEKNKEKEEAEREGAEEGQRVG